MEHLTLEALARLVDEVPDITERRHLAECADCRAELEAMVRQTGELAELPLDGTFPPDLGWEAVEAALRSDGLLREERSFAEPAPTLSWMRAAAALVLFAIGGAAGWGVRGVGSEVGGTGGGSEVLLGSRSEAEEGAGAIPRQGGETASVPSVTEPEMRPSRGSTSPASDEYASVALPSGSAVAEPTTSTSPTSDSGALPQMFFASAPPEAAAMFAFFSGLPYEVASLDEAESVVRFAESLYVDALIAYRNILERSGFPPDEDPVGRFVALGNVIAITEEAMNSAPTDPFFNTLLLNALVERNAVERRMMTFAAGY